MTGITYLFRGYFGVSKTQPQGALAQQLLADSVFPWLLEDSKALVTDEVRKKSMPLRTGFKMVNKAKPNLIERTMRELLPKFVEALEPFYSRACAELGKNFRGYLLAHQSEVAEALLSVSDRRIARAYNPIIKSGYDRLRGRAQREVMAALPDIVDLMARYVDAEDWHYRYRVS
jgi:hypothetical protein